jgi:AcrR family transcriptional regulator
MKEIVEKTGMSKGAFYHYFPSKEDLFIEIIGKYYVTFAEID